MAHLSMTDNMTVPVVLARIDRAHVRHTHHPRHRFAPLDLKYIEAGLAVRGIDSRLLDGWLEPFESERFAAAILAHRPRLAVLQAVSWCLEESLAVAHRLRQANVITLAVGQQVAHHRHVPVPGWEKAYALALDGEPEEAVPQLIEQWLSGEVNHLHAPGALLQVSIQDPDRLPPPRFSTKELAAYPFPFPWRGRTPRRLGYLLTAWGCPRGCRHCTALVRKSASRFLRVRDLDAVVEEIERLHAQGADALAFEDDSLFVDRRRFLALADRLARSSLGLRWMANARPDEIDAEIADAAAAAGAALIKLGIDHGSPRLIEAIGKTRDGSAWVAASEQAVEWLDRRGIGVVALFVTGLPGENEDDRRRSEELALRLPADYLQVQRFVAYPDTSLAQTEKMRHDYHYGPEGRSALIRFYRRFYLRPAFLARHFRHCWRSYLAGRGPFSAARFVLSREP